MPVVSAVATSPCAGPWGGRRRRRYSAGAPHAGVNFSVDRHTACRAGCGVGRLVVVHGLCAASQQGGGSQYQRGPSLHARSFLRPVQMAGAVCHCAPRARCGGWLRSSFRQTAQCGLHHVQRGHGVVAGNGVALGHAAQPGDLALGQLACGGNPFFAHQVHV